MKIFILLMLTSLISAGSFMAALSLSFPYPLFISAFLPWWLFIRYCQKRFEKAQQQKVLEENFREYVRRKKS